MSDIFGTLDQFEIPESPGATSMNYSFGDTLMVEALDLQILGTVPQASPLGHGQVTYLLPCDLIL